MSTPVDIPGREVFPDRASLLGAADRSRSDASRRRQEKSADLALSLLNNEGKLRALLSPVSSEDFKTVFHGEGRNEDPAPLAHIFPKARRLELFIVTLGEAVSEDIARLHREGDYPTEHFLDEAASRSIQEAVAFLERRGAEKPAEASLAYSPGYCGWHVSGQRRLLTSLDAGAVGVSFNDGFMMTPVKSASGVIVSGDPEIHDFTNAYSFCAACETQNCRDRILGVQNASQVGA